MILLGTFAAFGLTLVAMWLVVFWRTLGLRLRVVYFSALIIAAVMAAWTTFWFEYFPNENTRICGWPAPVIIFQRDGAEAPWLDYVGPTIVLAYPMNLSIFMVVPSIVVLGWAGWKRWGGRPVLPN